MEVFAARQHPTKQYRHVNRRDLGTGASFSGVHLDKVVEKTMNRRAPDAPESEAISANSGGNFRAGTIAALLPIHRAARPKPVAAILLPIRLSPPSALARSRTRPVWGRLHSRRNRMKCAGDRPAERHSDRHLWHHRAAKSARRNPSQEAEQCGAGCCCLQKLTPIPGH